VAEEKFPRLDYCDKRMKQSTSYDEFLT